MKKTNSLSSSLGRFFFVLCFFVSFGLTTAGAQTLKQSDEAQSILKQEGVILRDKLPTLVPASAAYNYTAAKLTAIRSISEAISSGETTEKAIVAIFALGAGKVQTEAGGFTDRAEATQARQELELSLKN